MPFAPALLDYRSLED